MNVEAEIRELQRRVGEREGSFGFLTTQVRGVHRDLLNFREHVEAFEARTEAFEARTGAFQAHMVAFQARTEVFQARTEERLDRLDSRLGLVEAEVRGLRQDLPGIVGGAVREAFQGMGR